MATNPEALAQLVRTVLAGPHAELAMKRQVLALARENLHLPAVPAALIETLPLVNDRETRDALLALVSSLDPARLPSLGPLHDALLAALAVEKERGQRVQLLTRLGAGLARDPRLLPAFLEVVKKPETSDDEKEAAASALARLVAPSEAAALAALAAAQSAPGWVRAAAVGLATRCPQLTDALAAALAPFLDPRVDAGLRLTVLRALAQARRLSDVQLPALRTLLRDEDSSGVRLAALELLAQVAPWSAEHWELLLWSAARDGDAGVRARAVALQKEAPDPSPALLAQLCAQLGGEASAGVRLELIALLQRNLRLPEVREALSSALVASGPVLADGELAALADALAPYAGRDERVRDRLFAAAEALPRVVQRQVLLAKVLPRVKVDESLPLLTRLFARERDETLRAQTFAALRPLSLARHPELVRAFCDELLEPGSRLRAECAAALGAAAETAPEAVAALEEVIATESDRELVRACLDGYLRPRVTRRFAPLFAVVRNEALDTSSRERCLAELVKLPLSPAETAELGAALAGLPAGTLRRPA